MSRLSKFQRKPIILEMDVPKEDGTMEIETIVVTPFKTPDMQLLMDLSNPDKAVQATHIILKRVLKENIPDFTQAEYDKLDYAYCDKILNAVMDSNTLDVDQRKRRIIEEIKTKQRAAGLIPKEETIQSQEEIIEGGAVFHKK